MNYSKKHKKRIKTLINRRIIFFLFLLVIFLLLVALFLIYLQYYGKIKKIKTSFIVGENPGFDLRTDELAFGKIVPGGSSTRAMTLTNEYNYPVLVKIKPSKNIENIISYEEEISLAKNESKKIYLSLSIPEDYPYGEYQGFIKLRIIKTD